MASYTNKLINPSPYKVRIPYDRGTFIVIEPDGEYEFVSADQQKDFLPDQPGSEEVRHLLESVGVFLLNPDLSYDVQALKALESSYRVKKDQLDAFTQQLQNNRISAGRAIDENTMNEAIESAGYGTKINRRSGMPGIKGQLEALQKRIKYLRKAVESDPTRGYVKEKFDPERTCFVTNPPRQFPSKTALLMFLDENPAIKEQHEKYLKASQSRKAVSEV